MSDQARLAEIKERADAATEGPWEAKRDPVKAEWMAVDTPVDLVWFPVHPHKDAASNMDDAKFIAHARGDVPWLLGLCVRQAEQLDQARTLLADAETLITALHKALPDDGKERGQAPSWWELGVRANGVRARVSNYLRAFLASQGSNDGLA